MSPKLARLFDFRRLCQWTAYSVGARDATLMDQPYPQRAHGTKYCAPARRPDAQVQTAEEGGALPERSVEADSSEIEVTQFEALQLQAGEFAISKLLKPWNVRKHHLANRAKILVHKARRLGGDYEFYRQRHLRDKGNAKPREWPWCFLVAMLVALAVPEYPLTRSAFEVFRLSVMETQLAAMGCSLCLIFLAHTVGRALREGRRGVVPALAAVMLLAGLVSLAFLRTDELERVETAQHARLEAELAALTATAEESGASLPTISVSSSSSGTDPRSVLSLGMVAALFVVAGIVIGFLAHDPDPELPAIVRAKARSWRQLQRVQRKIARATAAYDGLRAETDRRVTAERERTLMTLREHRYASELWRLPTLDRPPCFGESVDERLFKIRDLGPEILPLGQSFENLVGIESGDSPSHNAEAEGASNNTFPIMENANAPG